jgi:hypothetical protein
VFGCNGICQCAPGVTRRHQNFFTGINDLSRLSHEPHRHKNNGLGLGPHGIAAKLIRIAHEVSNPVNKLRTDIRMHQNNSILLFLKGIDLIDQRDKFFTLFQGILANVTAHADVLQFTIKLFWGHDHCGRHKNPLL